MAMDNNHPPVTASELVDLFGSDDAEDILDETGKDSDIEEESEDEPEKKAKKEPEPEDEIELDDTDDLSLKEVPSNAQLTKEFPELFKKFPTLKSALAREEEYTKVFATVEDAKEAQESVENFRKFESSLLSGNTKDVFQAIKEADPNSYAKAVDGLFATLQEVDKDSYYGLLAHVVRSTAVSMYQAGAAQNDKNLQAAAVILNKFALGTEQIRAPERPKTQEEDPDRKKLDEERVVFIQQRLETAKGDVSDRVTRIIEDNIDKYIDPKNVMTAYVRDKAKSDILESLDETLESDSRFKRIIDRLWEEALDSNFSEGSKEKIRRAFLIKAKVVLPDILRKVRNQALKGSSSKRKVTEDVDEEPIRASRPARKASTESSDKKPKMSLTEFIMSD